MYIFISKTLLTFDIKIPNLWLFHWPKTYSKKPFHGLRLLAQLCYQCLATSILHCTSLRGILKPGWNGESSWCHFAITLSTYQSTSTICHHLPSSTIIYHQSIKIYQNITIFLHPHIRVEQRSISNLQARHAGSRACVVASWFTASWTATGTDIFQTVDVSCVPWSLTVADLQQGWKINPCLWGLHKPIMNGCLWTKGCPCSACFLATFDLSDTTHVAGTNLWNQKSLSWVRFLTSQGCLPCGNLT